QHHTVEDVGLVLGTALRRALGERRGIRRMGSAFVPMDEALAFCAVDLSGRPFTVIRAAFAKTHQGGFELDLVPEFFRALATESRSTWHLAIQAGANEHHKAEALFKAAGRALGDAAARDPARGATVPSTKGVLE
ncbi:MAG: imidazoleglycerol-phosphate dehydratase, partial [Gammaproteobacteria bacterium]|nr:imidazoleglycerol-phosphate dehydratase [Gemmatimonadota bacterium]NIU79283.1 imidazoleglycerol-phosphate dehydratase [Gammaproteobacteria bacterium]